MGKTVPSFRMALEFEIERWRRFKKALERTQDQETFEEMMDACRNNAMAGGAACNPIIFEPMIMSVILAQQQKITALEYSLYELL